MGVAMPRSSQHRPNIDRAHENSPYTYELIAKIILKKYQPFSRNKKIADKYIILYHYIHIIYYIHIYYIHYTYILYTYILYIIYII